MEKYLKKDQAIIFFISLLLISLISSVSLYSAKAGVTTGEEDKEKKLIECTQPNKCKTEELIIEHTFSSSPGKHKDEELLVKGNNEKLNSPGVIKK